MSDKIKFNQAVQMLDLFGGQTMQLSFSDSYGNRKVFTTNAATLQQLFAQWVDMAPGRAVQAEDEISLLEHDKTAYNHEGAAKPWQSALRTLRLQGATHLQTVLSKAKKEDGSPVVTLRDVSNFGEAKMLKLPSCGPKTVQAARALLFRYGIGLAK
jgi:hypothetical protein